MVKWRGQYAERGLAGLEDAPGPGPKTVLTQDAVAEILAATVTPPPEALRALGSRTGRAAAGGLAGPAQEAERQPRQHQPAVVAVLPAAAPRRGVKFSTGPQLDAKVRDVIGLYLNSPDNAVVVCVDEKAPVPGPGTDPADLADAAGHPRAADPRLRPARGHLPVRRPEHRHGQVADACCPRRRHQEFVRFLKMVAAAYPGQDLHVICDNHGRGLHQSARTRHLLRNPRAAGYP